MNRLGGVMLAAWMVAACGGSQPAAEEAGATPAMSEPLPASEPQPQPPPKEIQPGEVPPPTPIAKEPEEGLSGPDEYVEEEEYGVAAGVEGGVPGGVVGGILGGPPPPPPPPPASAPKVVPSTLIEQQRIAGDKNLLPSDDVKLAIKHDGKTRLVVVVKMCLDENGTPSTVGLMKSGGYPAYDRLITTTIARTWRYRPFQVNGNYVPVCTAVTFIYKQDNGDDDAGK